ncbi:MAG: hypothetical protein MJ000_11490 [Bacteroidales bacterium]|nr:hypothetical protein [Bacteroidales bacterium]
MKKVLLIMAAALMTMTQCRKQETMPVTPATDTIKMTITAGPGRTGINTETGAITWSKGDKLYVSDGAKWLGSLDLVGEGGSAQGTFTGSIAAIGGDVTTCHFFYLGHDNGMAEPTGTTAASISFAAQDGTIDGAMKYHTGYGSTDVTVAEGEAAGYVVMNTKIAIAHFNFTKNSQPYTGAVTMGGTGIRSNLSVSPNGTFSGSGGGITIDKGDGTTGERYVTLIPATTPIVSVAFTGDATGGMTFLAGIRENKFYGMKDAMTVTLEAASAPKFTVGMDGDTPRTVEFAPGNLWYGKADGEEKAAFHFEKNQWDYSVGEEIFFGFNWDASHVSHFFWSATASVAYAEDYSDDDASSSDVFFTNTESFQVDGEAGWRTLSNAEWEYLLGTANPSRANATSLRAWKELDDGTHKGLVILPDGTKASVMSSITSTADLATSGAVFLPAAGDRNGTYMNNVGSNGTYWSSSFDSSQPSWAYFMDFNSDGCISDGFYRESGFAVRLVR